MIEYPVKLTAEKCTNAGFFFSDSKFYIISKFCQIRLPNGPQYEILPYKQELLMPPKSRGSWEESADFRQINTYCLNMNTKQIA